MSKRRSGRRKSNITGITLAVIAIAILVIGGLIASLISSRGNGADTPPRESETTFSVSTRKGQPAPAFTAIGADGQPYTVTPGDGRPKALIFYMGFR